MQNAIFVINVLLTDTDDNEKDNVDNQLSQCGLHVQLAVGFGLLGLASGP